MSVNLKINNYTSLNVKERTTLNGAVPIGSTSLVLANNQRLAQNDYALLGEPGSETGEIVVIQSVADAVNAVVSPTTLDHYVNDPVTVLIGNQIRIYRASNIDGTVPDDSAFAVLEPVAIDPDQLDTEYTDFDGNENYWYKFTYYNSTSEAETSLSDSGASRGGGIGDYCSIDDVREEAGFKRNRNISDAEIDKKRKAAQAEVDSALSGLYQLPLKRPVNEFIADLTARLAAGLLLTKQFGTYSTLNTSNGSAKLKEARGQLVKLQTNQMALVGVTGVSQEIPGAGSVAGWPNNTTDGIDGSLGGDSGPGFRRSTRY